MSEHVVSPEAAEAMQKMKDDFRKAEEEHVRNVRLTKMASAAGVLFLVALTVAFALSFLINPSERVVYCYEIQTLSGKPLEVTETVEYQRKSCATVCIEADFTSESSAEQFLEKAQDEYESTLMSASTEGKTAVLRLDLSLDGIDRAEYEKALRNTVGAFEIASE